MIQGNKTLERESVAPLSGRYVKHRGSRVPLSAVLKNIPTGRDGRYFKGLSKAEFPRTGLRMEINWLFKSKSLDWVPG